MAEDGSLQLRAQKIGANVGEDMTDTNTDQDPPLIDESDEDTKRFSISVFLEAYADLKQTAWYWTERRRIRGKKKKWMVSAVCRRFITLQLKAFRQQLGLKGETPSERLEELTALLAALAKERQTTFEPYRDEDEESEPVPKKSSKKK